MEGDPSVAAAQPPAAAAAAAADQVMLQNLRRLFQSSAETFTPLPAGAMADQSHGNAPFEAMRHAADLTPRVGCHQSPQYEIPRRPHPSGQPSHSADTSVQRTPPTPVEVSAPSAARFLQPQLAEMMHVFSSAPQPTFPAAPTTPQPPHTHMLLGTGETQQPQQPGLHQQYQQELFAQIFQQQQQLGAGYHGLVTRDRHSGGTPGGSVSAAESSIPTAYQYYGDYSGIRPQSQAGSSPPMVQKSSMPVGAEMSPFQLEAAPQQQLAQACMQPGVASPESSTSAHGLPILVLCEARGCGALLEVGTQAIEEMEKQPSLIDLLSARLA